MRRAFYTRDMAHKKFVEGVSEGKGKHWELNVTICSKTHQKERERNGCSIDKS